MEGYITENLVVEVVVVGRERPVNQTDGFSDNEQEVLTEGDSLES